MQTLNTADSPVFLVGAGRSGTTWLQLLLSQSPYIATTAETHLFSGYLFWVNQRWHLEKKQRARGGNTGIAQLFKDDGDFYRTLGCIATDVIVRIRKLKPTATVVLEKTPNHAQHSSLILNVFPNARFLHLVRDPRAVSASLRAAGRGWAKAWAPTGPAAAAEMWRQSVEAAHSIASKTDRFFEVKYEDLNADPVRCLNRLFSWLGIEASDDDCKTYVQNCTMDRLRESNNLIAERIASSTQRDSFFRTGRTDAWRSELTQREIALIEYVAGDMLSEFGYSPMKRRLRRAPLPVLVRRTLLGALWRVNRLVESTVKKL